MSLEGGADPGVVKALVEGFLLLAQVWWPIFVPISVLLVEPDRARRRLMGVALAAGVSVGLYLLWSILTRAHNAEIIDEHVVYTTETPYPLLVSIAYFAATVVPPLLSSRRVVAILGVVVFVGAATAYVFYYEAFVSVWCFFAAAASGVILFHFERERRRHRAEGLPV